MSRRHSQQWRGAVVAGLLAAHPVPAVAQAPATTLVARPLPANAVDCVYGYMSDEDREMSLLLLAREIVDGGRFRKTSRNVQAVDRLIEEAHQKCLARFRWSAARSSAATSYALTAILGEALDQALQSVGRPMDALNHYYSANRATFGGRSDLTKLEEDRLAAHLKSNGWEEASAGEISLAGLYVETLMLKDQAAREFDARPRAGQKPNPAPPVPARKAGRGKP